jgi:hypothetical protein
MHQRRGCAFHYSGLSSALVARSVDLDQGPYDGSIRNLLQNQDTPGVGWCWANARDEDEMGPRGDIGAPDHSAVDTKPQQLSRRPSDCVVEAMRVGRPMWPAVALDAIFVRELASRSFTRRLFIVCLAVSNGGAQRASSSAALLRHASGSC